LVTEKEGQFKYFLFVLFVLIVIIVLFVLFVLFVLLVLLVLLVFLVLLVLLVLFIHRTEPEPEHLVADMSTCCAEAISPALSFKKKGKTQEEQNMSDKSSMIMEEPVIIELLSDIHTFVRSWVWKHDRHTQGRTWMKDCCHALLDLIGNPSIRFLLSQLSMKAPAPTVFTSSAKVHHTAQHATAPHPIAMPQPNLLSPGKSTCTSLLQWLLSHHQSPSW
jgi:hypothetical protein